MTIKQLNGTILDSINDDMLRAAVAKERAITEYNIMMGIIEDPSEEDEETEESEEE